MLDSIKGHSAAGGGGPASPAPAPASDAVPESLSVSLKAVLERLPLALKPLVARAANPDETINVPTAKVLAQLSTGAVRITLGELRAGAPAGVILAGGQADALVDLPLPEVLRVAGPLLKRKSSHKAEPAAGNFFAPPAAAPPVAPAPAPAAPTPPAFAPAFQAAPPAVVPEPVRSAPTFTAFQPSTAPEPFVPGTSFFQAQPAETTAPGVVPIKLSVLTVGWPENVRKEAADLGDVTVEFPREELGNAMKSGKVVFTWGQLRSWMKPGVGSSGIDSTALQLPLRVLVQPFMSNMRGGAKPASTAPVSAGGSGTTVFLNRVPPPSLAVPIAASAPPAPPEGRLGEALGKPEKAHWTPTEIIQAVVGIPGVSGAMLSLQEGHLAAAELQATLPPELLAYALPKLFATTGEQARQMKLGEPGMISLVAEGHHWAVFKLEKIFFTVMSRKGQLLPMPQLNTIASEIARQRK
jgi:predicted regulator of Ras-like GTPase activity (Roadblock/LC7/MglB family)